MALTVVVAAMVFLLSAGRGCIGNIGRSLSMVGDSLSMPFRYLLTWLNGNVSIVLFAGIILVFVLKINRLM